MPARIWFITGAGSGFGRSLAQAALEAGDTVVAAVRRPETITDLIATASGRVTAVELDVTDLPGIEAAVAETIEKHGRIDILVNNAGRGLVGPAELMTDAELRDLMDLHFFGPAHLTRAVLPHMRTQGAGTVVQMSSQAGRYSLPGVSGYSATKFALEGWSEGLALEVAAHGIRVLIVEPGAFRTSFNEPGVLRFSRRSEIYRNEVEPTLTALAGADGKQPGDPDRAAAAIVRAVNSATPPLRLALGSDAAETIAASLERARDELAEWESVTRGTDFPSPVRS
ncbi:SDR family NAD(P)-dependent oxidoreductase [Nocardia sp. NPDC050712]|uniref:SDR family NAD(P)-dependent oxidoreductase n=1 Tax=Nocardia sp. NPDC050712 TaxID=3155518 RepID=UPI0033C55861